MPIKPFKLEQYFAQHEFSVPFQLCNSDCEALRVFELLALEPGAADRFQLSGLGYTETQGNPDLRTQIAGLYGDIEAEEVLVLSGAQEGIFLWVNTLLGPGDHAIVLFPTYESLYQVPESVSCQVTRWPLRENDEGRWSLDLDFLADAVRSNTRAILINTPNNPTGYRLDRAELDAVVQIAAQHGLYVFSDEVYAFLEEDGPPALCDLYDRAFTLGVMSKAFGLAGLRLGWVASRQVEALEQMRELRYYTTICNSAPSEFLAGVALRQRDTLLGRNRRIIAENIALFERFSAAHPALWTFCPPVAGPIAFPRLRTDEGATAFCERVINQAGVLLLPGAVYDFDDRHVRVGLGRRSAPRALAELGRFLDERYVM